MDDVWWRRESGAGRAPGVLKLGKEVVNCIREGWVPWTLCISADTIRDVLDALPHVPGFIGGEMPLDSLSICVSGPLNACSQLSPSFSESWCISRDLISAFSHGFWFGEVVTVLVVVTSSTCLEMKLRTVSGYSSRSTSPSGVAASLKTCQSVS